MMETKNREVIKNFGIVPNEEQNIANIMISAGAGAGKTQLMSETILNCLYENEDLKESEIVAITFTNAAAEEMKSRIMSVNHRNQEEGKAKRKINVDDINISTIHSFCTSLISQRVFECGAGIAPEIIQTSESEDYNASSAVMSFVRDWIRRNDGIIEQLQKYWGRSTLDIIKDTFFSVAHINSLKFMLDGELKKRANEFQKNCPKDVEPSDEISKLLADEMRKILLTFPNGISEETGSMEIDNKPTTLQMIINTYLDDTYRSHKKFQDVIKLSEVLEKYTDEKIPIIMEQRVCIDDVKKGFEQIYNALKAYPFFSSSKLNVKNLSNEEITFVETELSRILKAFLKTKPQNIEQTNYIFKADIFEVYRYAEDIQDIRDISDKDKIGILSKFDTQLRKYGKNPEIYLLQIKAVKPFLNITEEQYQLILKLYGLFGAKADLMQGLTDYYIDKTAEIIKTIYEEYHTSINKTEIDTDTLLYLARNLVTGKENRSVRDYFRSKYKMFFVDEFQDTDNLQLEIIKALAANEDNTLRKKCLFIVGDQKQSIYRFRGAEVGFYDYVEREYFGENSDNQFYTLSQNYRSDSKVIDWINSVYTGEFSNSPIKYQELLPMNFFSDENADIKHGVYSCTRTKESKYGYEDIADIVKSLTGKTMKVKTRTGEEIRKIIPQDILIITDTRGQATSIYNVLKAENIPTVVSGKIEPAEKRSVTRLYTLMKYLEHKTLRCRAELVTAFSPSSANGKGSFFDKYTKKQADELAGFIIETDKVFKEYGAMSAVYYAVNSGQLFDKNINHTVLVSEMPVLYQLVEKLASECNNHIGQITLYIDHFIKTQLQNVLNPSTETNCVRVMNLHQTKGLESNIVINYIRKSSRESKTSSLGTYIQYGKLNEQQEITDILESPKCYLSLVYRNGYQTEYLDTYDDDIKEIAVRLQEEENVRKKYVRDTRAKYVMINLYYETKGTIPDGQIPYEIIHTNISQDSERFTLTRKAEKMNLPESWYIKISPSGLEKTFAVSSKSSQSDMPDTDSTEPKNDPAGALYGTVMHRVFELYFANRKIASQNSLDEKIAFYVEQAIIENMAEFEKLEDTERSIESYRKKLKNDTAEFMERFNAPERGFANAVCCTETPFYFVIDNGSENPDSLYQAMNTVIKSNLKQNHFEGRKVDVQRVELRKIVFSGKTDLICIDKNGNFTVIDYKSDKAVCTEEILNKYEPQQIMYYLTMKKYLKGKPTDDKQHLYAPHAVEGKYWIERKMNFSPNDGN